MKDHKEAFFFSVVSLLGNLMPLLLGLLFYAANINQWTGLNIFYEDGQFYLYSASLLTSSGYIFFTYKIRNTGWNSILFFFSSFLLLVVSIFYAFKLADSNNNEPFILYSSMTVFIITIAIYYYSNLVNQKKVDVVKTQKEGVQEILDNL